jgi:BlaI family penicillinase repressor
MSEATPRPTPAETEILGVLWDRGPSTVRAVLEALGPGRTHVYRAAVRRDAVQRELVGDLIDRAFDGSAAELVMRALSSGRSTPQELDRIRELVDELARARGRKR